MSRCYEDLFQGQRFESGSAAIDLREMVEFARRYDPQPFHLDEAAARDSAFGALVASGLMTAAVTMRLIVDSELDPAGRWIGLGLERLEWPNPVRAGDRLTVTIEVDALRPSQSKPGYGVVKLHATTRNQRDEIVQSAWPAALVPRRATAASAPRRSDEPPP
ncbi:MAG: MaoC family dehydratase [Opitutaceae bacterium]